MYLLQPLVWIENKKRMRGRAGCPELVLVCGCCPLCSFESLRHRLSTTLLQNKRYGDEQWYFLLSFFFFLSFQIKADQCGCLGLFLTAGPHPENQLHWMPSEDTGRHLYFCTPAVSTALERKIDKMAETVRHTLSVSRALLNGQTSLSLL